MFEYDGGSYQFIREYTSRIHARVRFRRARHHQRRRRRCRGRAVQQRHPDRGTVFLYDLVASNELSLRQFLVPADVEVGDAFGWEVAIDEDHVVAGAFGEDYRESARPSA